MVWQFWGRAAEGVLSTKAQDVFHCAHGFTRSSVFAASGGKTAWWTSQCVIGRRRLRTRFASTP